MPIMTLPQALRFRLYRDIHVALVHVRLYRDIHVAPVHVRHECRDTRIEGVLIAPQEVAATEALDRIGEALKARGISLEDLIEFGRELRGDILRQRYGLSEEA